MSEQNSQQPAQSGTGRARTVLIIVIVILLLLLAGLAYVFYSLLKPATVVRPAGDEKELEWVRSIYGWGPTPQEQLNGPTAVAFAPSGDIYVTDPTNARVIMFRSDGTFRRFLQTGSGGTGAKQFIRPESIATDEDGNLYIADTWAAKIIVFNEDGVFVREWPVETQARGIQFRDDKVYVLGPGKVHVFTPAGKKVTSFGSEGRQPGQIAAYQGIEAIGEKIYVADTFNKRLQSFSQSGTTLWTVPSGDAARSGPTNQANRGGDGSGSRAVPNHRWDTPQDLVADGSGNLVVVDAFQFEVAVVDPKSGTVKAAYGEYGSEDGQFFYPTGVDYDPRRDWFAIADTRNNRVQIVRIPDSGGGVAAQAWRAAASPYRYLAVPGLLLLLAVVFSVWAGRRVVNGGAARRETPVA